MKDGRMLLSIPGSSYRRCIAQKEWTRYWRWAHGEVDPQVTVDIRTDPVANIADAGARLERRAVHTRRHLRISGPVDRAQTGEPGRQRLCRRAERIRHHGS